MLRYMLALAALATGSSMATKLYFVKSATEVSSHTYDTLYMADTETKNFSVVKLGNTIPPDFDFVSGGIMCCTRYTAVFTNIDQGSAGVGTVDLGGNREFSIVPTPAPALYHVLACDPTSPNGTTILAVASEPAPPGQDNAPFSVRRFNVVLGTETKLASFPSIGWGGQDGIFSFNLEKNEVWAAFPVVPKLYVDGHSVLCVTDLATNNTVQYNMGEFSGYAYHLIANDAAGGAHVVMHRSKNPPQYEGLKWNDISFSGTKLSLKPTGRDVTETMNTGSQPLAHGAACGGMVYGFDPQPAVNLNGYNAQTGAVEVTMNWIDVPNAGTGYPGGLACAP